MERSAKLGGDAAGWPFATVAPSILTTA